MKLTNSLGPNQKLVLKTESANFRISLTEFRTQQNQSKTTNKKEIKLDWELLITSNKPGFFACTF